MTGWNDTALSFARTLRGNALAGAVLALVVLLAGGTGCVALMSLLIMTAALSVLASATYLLFEAALFRLAATYPREVDGLAAIDDTLDRMGLRSRPSHARPLASRIDGTRRILFVHHVALATFLVLFAVRFFAENARC